MAGRCSLVDPYLMAELPSVGEYGFRDTTGKTPIARASLIGTRKTFITLGQSNFSTSIGTTTYTTVSPNALNLNPYDGGLYGGSDAVLGCNSGGAGVSSINMAIADSVISRGKAANCVVCPVSMGGTSWLQWAPSPLGLHGRLVAAIWRCRALGLEPDAILAGCGETDNALGTPSAPITAAIWALVDYIRAAPISCGAPFYLGLYSMNAGVIASTVRTGINNAVHAGRNIVLGYDADTNLTVAGGFRLGDGTHLSNSGRSTGATGWSTLVFP